MQIVAAERANRYTDNSGYDPATYLEANLFGEEDTRSNMMRLVSQRLTKIINIPNMKDHGATGATGCLKNIAYGSFSNVARTHQRGVSHTYSVVGTLATIEPLRSRTVLQIMDGLRGVWHGGPFARTTKYVFYPKQIMFGTDPVAIDRLLLDIIDNERREQGVLSIWDRSPASLKMDDTRARDADPNVNIIIREPGHVEYAVVARPGRLRPGEDQGPGHHRMTPLLLVAARGRPVRLLDAGDREPRDARGGRHHEDLRPADQVEAWKARGLHRGRDDRGGARLARGAARARASPRAPALASPTRSPWIVANGWRIARRPGSEVRLRRCPAGKAALAAAEAFAYGADAVLNDRPRRPRERRRDADVPRRACPPPTSRRSPTSPSWTTARRSPAR